MAMARGVGLACALVAGCWAATAAAQQTPAVPAPPTPPKPAATRAAPEVALTFGAVVQLHRDKDFRPMPLGLRGGYQFETGPYVGAAGEWSLSLPNERESSAGYYQLAAEFGYDYSPLPRFSAVPFARVGYAQTFQTFCGRPSSSGCDLERDDGVIGQLGVRTLFRSGHFFGGFEFDYQFGTLENIGFRFSNGIRF